MRIIGLDLSLASTGVAGYEPGQVELHRVQSKSRGSTLADRANRLHSLLDQVWEHVTYSDLVVVEGPSLGQSRQGGQHDRAGLWWLVVSSARLSDLPVAEIPPACVKKYATGKGNASKDEVLAAVVRRYPDVPVMGNDEADALALVAMAAHHYQVSTLPTVPQTHAAALEKVNWPEVSRG
jgi:crossover junction endodeoxyribonuclease RuvC